METFNIRHSGLDPESNFFLDSRFRGNDNPDFKRIFMQRLGKVLRKKKKFRFDLQDVYCSLRDNFSFASRQIVVLRFLGLARKAKKANTAMGTSQVRKTMAIKPIRSS